MHPRNRIIKFIGSGASLLSLMILNDKNRFHEDMFNSETDGTPGLAYMLGACICIDTKYFEESIKDKTWQEEDLHAHKFLANYHEFKKT